MGPHPQVENIEALMDAGYEAAAGQGASAVEKPNAPGFDLLLQAAFRLEDLIFLGVQKGQIAGVGLSDLERFQGVIRSRQPMTVEATQHPGRKPAQEAGVEELGVEGLTKDGFDIELSHNMVQHQQRVISPFGAVKKFQ
jgi:hypothetical protein